MPRRRRAQRNSNPSGGGNSNGRDVNNNLELNELQPNQRPLKNVQRGASLYVQPPAISNLRGNTRAGTSKISASQPPSPGPISELQTNPQAHGMRITPLGKRIWDKPATLMQQPSLTPPPARKASLSNALGKLMRLPQLVKDGRKVPQYYRDLANKISAPSELSVEGLSEKYQFGPGKQFQTLEDIYHYRGYRKLGKIDEGAFGIVSKAVRIGDDEVVAVKEIDLDKKRAKRVEEMKRELFVLQRFESKYVVQVVEHFVAENWLVIVMEYCAGGNLSGLLKETALNEEECKHLFSQMALAIKSLHRAGIAHRDIKLNNFLLDASRRQIKVADFGLSIVSWRPPSGMLMAKTYCGTEPYMAPEILRRNKRNLRCYNPMISDVWSLGVCLFAMMTRTFPFKLDLSQNGLFRAQTARRWRFPRSIRENCSEELNDLAWHMLDPEPERRITILGVLQHPWLNTNHAYVQTPEATQDTRTLMMPAQQPSPATRL